MQNVNQIITTAINKAKENPEFSEDLMKYVQYLAVSLSPNNNLPQLKQILETGNMKNLLEFGTETVPNFNNQIVEYINKY